MSSPGVVYIRTHLHDKDGFDENSYLQWVEKSISRIIVNPNVHSAFLYKNNEPGADTPYMALYAITNLKQWETEQLALVSRKLPGDIIEEEQSILAALDVSVRNLQFLERCPSETASGT